jgi:hypothetical protein
MKLQTPQRHSLARTWFRVILVIVAIALAVNLVIQLQKVWKRVTAKKAIPAPADSPEASTPTNTPPSLTNASFVMAPAAPQPAMAMAPTDPEAPPQLVVRSAQPQAPVRTNPPASTGGGSGSPAGFGRMGFPPGTAPVVYYQPGTLTFVAIPYDSDDLTNRPPGSTNQVPVQPPSEP